MQKDRNFMWFVILGCCIIQLVNSVTDPNDFRILNEFRSGLENSELLQWPEKDEDPCGNKWKHVYCDGDRVSQIQVQGLGLKGTLPRDFNQLTKMSNLGLQRNKFHGKLPTFSGLSELQYVYLDFNNFDEIPADFFDGLTSAMVIALDDNPLNATTGWKLPDDVGKLSQLVNLSLGSCNLVGPLPDYLGSLTSMTSLKLSYNRLSGVIPLSLGKSMLQILWLNDQAGEKMSGSIDVIASIPSLTQAWLHGNKFTGTIPDSIGNLTSLKDLNLNQNKLVGVIPEGLASLELDKLDLSNNMLIGPIPKFKSRDVSYGSNSFCQSERGVPCAPQIDALIDFLGGVSYPTDLSSKWSGNDPCSGSWLGVSCNSDSQVVVLNLPNRHLYGTLSPSVGRLDSLRSVTLSGNNFTGQLPENLTELKFLTKLDVEDNDIAPPLPAFRKDVVVLTAGNPLLAAKLSGSPPVTSPPPVTNPPPIISPPIVQSPPSPDPSQGTRRPPPPREAIHFPSVGSKNSSSADEEASSGRSKGFPLVIVVASVAGVIVLVLLLILFYMFCCMKKKNKTDAEASNSIVIHPRDPTDPDKVVKVAVTSGSTGSLFTQTSSSSGSNSGMTDGHVIESGNLAISVQVLRKGTDNFAEQNKLGCGGFGTVYKGELTDGTTIAVKRMEAGVIDGKLLNEFQAEIVVLSKLRHRHLVTLFGYATEGCERLLVYEYMPQGALSKHLFHWRSLGLDPLSWRKRLSIALDVARGMEYLHNLGQQTFIHRDLKSSNILLDDEYRAKVSDFGLVKLAPGSDMSVSTRLAGTFGYLAPEYAVTGKITTKVDVFSFGVVLMELLTGLRALDEGRSEETRYLAEWFVKIKGQKRTLMLAIDSAMGLEEDAYETINTIADLAGHCTARDPNHRPDMGHAVSVLTSLVNQWKPFADGTEDVTEEYIGIDFTKPLIEEINKWKKEENYPIMENINGWKEEKMDQILENSCSSIPSRPDGFAVSFASSDGR